MSNFLKQKCWQVGFTPDPTGELIWLPRPHSWVRGWRRGGKMWRKGRRVRKGCSPPHFNYWTNVTVIEIYDIRWLLHYCVLVYCLRFYLFLYIFIFFTCFAYRGRTVFLCCVSKCSLVSVTHNTLRIKGHFDQWRIRRGMYRPQASDFSHISTHNAAKLAILRSKMEKKILRRGHTPHPSRPSARGLQPLDHILPPTISGSTRPPLILMSIWYIVKNNTQRRPSPRPRGSARRKTASSLILRGHF